MNKYLPITLLAVWAAACQKNSDKNGDAKAIAELSIKIDTIDKKLDRIGAARANAAPARKRPTVGQRYKIPVMDNDAYRGGKFAKVTVAIASEFACPYCAQLAKVSDELLDLYEDEELKLVSKHFIIHPKTATKPALASCAANLQGQFGAYEQELWKSAWPGQSPRLKRDALSEQSLESIATKVGLDLSRFHRDMENQCKTIIARNRRELSALGVNGTPAVYINGIYYGGARSVEGLKTAIDQELKKADLALAKGIPLPDYYPSLIAKGKTTI